MKEKILMGVGVLILIICVIGYVSSNKTPSNNNDNPKYTFALTTTSKTLSVGGSSTISINTNIENYQATDIVWTSSDSTIVNVDSNGYISGLQKGSATVTALYEYKGQKYKASCFVVISDGKKYNNITSLAFQDGEIAMNVGSTYQAPIVVTPLDADLSDITYNSSNEGVATISTTGQIKAISEGTATISFNSSDGKWNGKIRVNVSNTYTEAKMIVYPDEIYLKEAGVTLPLGQEYKLNTVFFPKNATEVAIEWTSSDEKVATVSNGVVKGLAVGNAVITAKTINGKSINAIITVVATSIPATSVKVDKESVTLNVGESAVIVPDVQPSNATNKQVIFSSANINVATVDDDGIITATGAGEVIITVRVRGTKIDAYVKVTVNKPNSGGSSGGNTGGNSGGSSGGSTGGNTGGNGNSGGTPIDPNAGSNDCSTCRSGRAQTLIVSLNGRNIPDDNETPLVIKVNQTVNLTVKLPTNCGKLIQLQQSTADGLTGVDKYITQYSSPSIHYTQPSTYRAISSYTWVITGVKSTNGQIWKLSQTARVKTTCTAENFKAMFKLRIKVVD